VPYGKVVAAHQPEQNGHETLIDHRLDLVDVAGRDVADGPAGLFADHFAWIGQERQQALE